MKRLNLFMGAAALAALFLAAPGKVNAQENGNRDALGNIVRGPYETNRFGDNWFINLGGGINMFMHDDADSQIGPSIDLNAGKWITPAIGMRAGYQGIKTDGLGYMYFHGDVLWNASDAISGYKETRFWNLIPYLHGGYYRSYGLGSNNFADNEFAAGAGLLHNLRLSDRLDIVIDMRATVVSAQAIGSSGVALMPSVTAGLAVDLGWPNFVRTSTVIGALETANAENTVILETAVAALELANTTLEKENMNLKKANNDLKSTVNSMKNAEKPLPVSYEDMSPITVYFEIGQAVLNNLELQHLNYYVSKILEKVDNNTNVEITLMGTADSNTGTMKRNEFLSNARGKYIMNLLTSKYGISPDRVVVKSEVVKASADPDLLRSAIISF